MSYCHLTSDDRVRIATLLDEGNTQSYIARRIGVHRSTICRELSHNKKREKPKPVPMPERLALLDIDCRHVRGSGRAQDKYEALEHYKQSVREVQRTNRYYDARSAQRIATSRRTVANRQRTRLVYRSGSGLEDHVRKQLLSEQWSPEQICGELNITQGIQLSPQTIYDYIATCPDKTDKKRLQKQLRHGGKPYRHHGTKARAKARQRALPSINNRPLIIETKQRLGDLEGDTIVGHDTKDRFITHVDRVSGEGSIDKLLGYSARKVTDMTARRFGTSPTPVRTVTYDRGVEFSDYERLGQTTSATIYFANAYHSWERGCNENFNGLIRQYFPKRTDFKKVTAKHVKTVEAKLNTRPRKRYNWRNPIQQRQYLQRRQKLGCVALRDGM